MKGENAMVPPRIFLQCSVLGGFRASGLVGAYIIMFVYFLPVWFEGVKCDSAFEAGVHLLPLVLSMVVGSIAAGSLTSAIGYYTPILLIGTCVPALGAGLLTMLHPNTSEGHWIGY
jgi:hypothetical protein